MERGEERKREKERESERRRGGRGGQERCTAPVVCVQNDLGCTPGPSQCHRGGGPVTCRSIDISSWLAGSRHREQRRSVK